MSENSLVRTRYEVDDLLEAREWVEQAYGANLQIRADRERAGQMTIDQVQSGQLTLVDVNVPFDVGFQVSGQGEYVFIWQRAGDVEIERAQEINRFVPGDVFLGIRPEDEERSRNAYADLTTVSLPARLLDQSVELNGGRSSRRWEFTAMATDETGARRWRRAVGFVRQTLTELDVEPSPLVLGSAARLLADTALQSFPNNARFESTIEDAHDAHPPTVRRAITFIESHPDLDLTVVDIARAAHVTPRALQMALRRHLDTTPLNYLRTVRLDRAHADLRAADPAVDTVTAIAARWGWSRPSRFVALITPSTDVIHTRPCTADGSTAVVRGVDAGGPPLTAWSQGDSNP